MQLPVFPTHVGVFPGFDGCVLAFSCLPHARGGVSLFPARWRDLEGSSPRTWGCFRGRAGEAQRKAGLPHARGGVSDHSSGTAQRAASSPRTWGCFHFFPLPYRRHFGLPHARGGVSAGIFVKATVAASSPRTWGCFYVDDFEELGTLSLPHARGGVSFCLLSGFERFESSPRMWGCFQSAGRQNINSAVFPTHVGVFLLPAGNTETAACLPHARGGVSLAGRLIYIVCQSSPRTWGCFLLRPHTRHPRAVFPTHVGVFPSPGTGT